MNKIQIKSGDAVYWDSFAGLLKAKYLRKEDNILIYLQITARNNKYYKFNDVVLASKSHTIPRQCYHKTGIFTYSVYPEYEFI